MKTILALGVYLGSVYVISILGVMIFLKKTQQEAQKKVNTFIKNVFFCEEPLQRVILDQILINDLIEALSGFNQLDSKYVKHKVGMYNDKIPCINLQWIPKDEDDFDKIQVQLNNAAEKWLCYRGINDACIFVMKKKIPKGSYVIHVMVAILDEEKSALQEFLRYEQELAEKEAMKKQAPILDTELEKELMLVEQDDTRV